MNNAKIGTALIGGYVLGRRRKAKAALGLALGMAVKRARAGDLAKTLTPVLGNLNRQARTELTNATKAAASSVLDAQATRLADALHERTLGLQAPRADEVRDEVRDKVRKEDREEDRVEDREEDREQDREEGSEKDREEGRGERRGEKRGEKRREVKRPRERRPDDG